MGNGFKGVGDRKAFGRIAGAFRIREGEIERKDPQSKDFRYDWAIKHG